MNRSVARLLYAAVLLAALVVLPLYAYKVYLKTDYTDFSVYYRAALRMKERAWEIIYTFQDGPSPFRYPPILLPLLRPFAELTQRQAQLIWYGLQYLWFATGFAYLYRTARAINAERAGMATALSFLFVLRFCLDTFTIGQVSSLMFLGYCLALEGYVRGDYFKSGAGLFIPTLFKIGPGFTYLLYPFSKLEQWIRAWLAPLLFLIMMTLASWIAVGGWSNFSMLTRRWTEIVRGDNGYYDASHYGSQCIKSVLLRYANAHWISPNTAIALWLGLSALGCMVVLWIWATRRARTPQGKALQFSLGIFTYVWFMPETFKYSLTMLAIPALVLLVSPKRTRLGTLALAFGFIVLSAAGKDLLPDFIFFGLQKISMPFYAMILLGGAILQQLWQNTVPWHEAPLQLPRPWDELPLDARHEGVSVLIPLSDQAPSRACLNVIPELQSALSRQFGSNWELIWIAPSSSSDPRHASRFEELTRKFPQSKLVFSSEPGRGYSLREGFLASSGKWVYLYRLEQPVGVRFLNEAMTRLQSGYELVRANRRDAETRFLIPVRNLRVAYRRHRLGLLFNRLVRLLLPKLETSDTHSGHLLMTRAAAAEIFALQTTGDFLFELELCLISKAHSFRETELPVQLYLFEEKSGERILSEIISILTGLPHLRRRYRAGCYEPLKRAEAITADDWGISPAVNQGILNLARQGVVKRVSIMPNTSFFTDGLEELKAVPGVSLGLHFTLTYGRPLSTRFKPLPPKKLLLRWLNPLAPKAELRSSIEEELRAQIRALQSRNVKIDYFDGHHHIHLIPGLLDALASILAENRISTVRLPYDPELRFSAKFPLLPLSWLARGAVKRHGFESMPVFYPLRAHFLDHGLLRAKVNRNPHAEVIVHPASYNDIDQLEFPDSYTQGRVDEFRALRMLGFLQKLSREEALL